MLNNDVFDEIHVLNIARNSGYENDEHLEGTETNSQDTDSDSERNEIKDDIYEPDDEDTDDDLTYASRSYSTRSRRRTTRTSSSGLSSTIPFNRNNRIRRPVRVQNVCPSPIQDIADKQ